MFFQDHEKTIYSPQGSDKQYDPLALDRELTKASSGNLPNLLKTWQAKGQDTGDISASGRVSKEVASAEAEEALVIIARKVFSLPSFPESLDAIALEYLCDYLEWMEKKGVREKKS